MVYVLIVLGLAVVIAPLMSAMPSKAQRAKASLRDEARSCNLRVSLRPLPPIPARFRFQSDDEFACYERRLSPDGHRAGRDEAYVSVEGIWSPTTGDKNTRSFWLTVPKMLSLFSVCPTDKRRAFVFVFGSKNPPCVGVCE